MSPNPKTGLLTPPKSSRARLPKNSAKFCSTSNTPTSSMDLPPTRTRRPPGSPHASRLLSHRVRLSHSTSTSHTVSAKLARPTRKLSLHAGLARRSPPTTLRTPTPSLATTQTLHTSSTSDWTLSSPSSRSTRPRNRCQAMLPSWS
jgi:hypothetical protein